MSVVVADLVAKLRVDSSGLQQSVQDSTQQLKGVQAQAEQTTRALEIMAAQMSKANPTQGTPAQILGFLQAGNVQPTAAAMAQATAEAQKAAAAHQQSAAAAQRTVAAVTAGVAPTQAAAKATADVVGGWNASESSIVRFGAALVGANLGISLIAGAGRLVHQVVSEIVVSQLDWERSLVNLSGLYGQVGTQAAALANAQANLPSVLGSQQEFAQAAINASALRLRYGLPQQTIDQLTTTGGRVAYATGMTDPAARAQLQQQILAATQTGAPLPAQYGVYTDPEAVSRRLGFQGQQALQAYTPQELMQARGAIVSEGLSAFADRAAANQRGALAAVTNAERAQERAQAAIQNNLEGSGGGLVQGPTTAERSLTQQILTGGTATTPPQATPYGPTAPANIQGLAAMDAEQRVMQSASRYAAALADSAKVQEDARKTLEQLAHSADAAGARLLSFAGSLEDQTSIAHGDILAQAQAGVTARARSAFPARAMSDPEIGAIARGTAAQDVYRNYVAPQAQQEQSNAIRLFLERQASNQGPGLEGSRNAAQAALAELPRREQAGVVTGQANRAGDLAARAGAEADAQLQAISLRSEERRLTVAEQLAGYRTQALQTEAQLAPILIQQANLRDRMVVAARDSLTSRRELIQAQQQALGATNVTSAYDYQAQRLELLAEQSRANVRAGGAPTQDISSLRQQYRGLELQRATSGADLAALDAQRGVQVVGQQRTGEQLTRDAALTNLEQQARALQDQQIPLDQNLRRYQAEEASIQRSLDLLNLTDVKQITAAARQQLAANQLKLVTDEIARQADDYANGLNLGATAAERSQAALEKARDALKETVPLLSSLASGAGSDVSARLANGLGAGGLGPTRGGPTGFSVVIEAGQTQEQFKTQVHISVEEALNKFFAGMSTSGPAAPSTVGGAGR